MRQYSVYEHPIGKIEAVKIGWSWPGFFFSWIWAMVKGMWGLGIGTLFCLIVLAGVFEEAKAEALSNASLLIISVLFGAQGNGCRIGHLTKRGYDLIGTVEASNREAAFGAVLKERRAA